MDIQRNVRTDWSKSVDSVYYFCASEFGWDKKTVDSQPISYIRQLINTHNNIKKEEEKEMRKLKR